MLRSDGPDKNTNPLDVVFIVFFSIHLMYLIHVFSPALRQVYSVYVLNNFIYFDSLCRRVDNLSTIYLVNGYVYGFICSASSLFSCENAES